MNKRINELRSQAIVCEDGINWILDEQRFAELIIQECIDILSEYRGKVIWKNEDNIDHPIHVIQKHFGIK